MKQRAETRNVTHLKWRKFSFEFLFITQSRQELLVVLCDVAQVIVHFEDNTRKLERKHETELYRVEDLCEWIQEGRNSR